MLFATGETKEGYFENGVFKIEGTEYEIREMMSKMSQGCSNKSKLSNQNNKFLKPLGRGAGINKRILRSDINVKNNYKGGAHDRSNDSMQLGLQRD